MAGSRRGDSKATSVPPGSPSTSRSSPRLRGRKPRKRHSAAGSPEATSAVIAADGPGSTSTGSPAATRAPHQEEARVGHERHAGVGDERDGGALAHALDQLRGARRLVVLVVGARAAP